MIDAAFTAIVAGDEPAIKRALSEVQRAEYGLRPWSPGLPDMAADGQRIVYKSPEGWLYTVWSGIFGSQIRWFSNGDLGKAGRFEARATDTESAIKAAAEFAAIHLLSDPRVQDVQRFWEGGHSVAVVVSYGRALD
jgi:hypothetical protein